MQGLSGDAMGYILVAVVVALLIVTISLPIHVFVRKISFRETMVDLRFWVVTFIVSVAVALLVKLSES